MHRPAYFNRLGYNCTVWGGKSGSKSALSVVFQWISQSPYDGMVVANTNPSGDLWDTIRTSREKVMNSRIKSFKMAVGALGLGAGLLLGASASANAQRQYDPYYGQGDNHRHDNGQHRKNEKRAEKRHQKAEKEALKQHQRQERDYYGNDRATREHQRQERERLENHRRAEERRRRTHQRNERNRNDDGYYGNNGGYNGNDGVVGQFEILDLESKKDGLRHPFRF